MLYVYITYFKWGEGGRTDPIHQSMLNNFEILWYMLLYIIHRIVHSILRQNYRRNESHQVMSSIVYKHSIKSVNISPLITMISCIPTTSTD